MLRALTSYFFGGIEDETPEAPIECETREVNDWLVVNLPDHNKDSIILNDDDESCEMDDENDEDDEEEVIEVDATNTDEYDIDEDDILLSLSILMMPPEAEKISTEFSDEQSFYDGMPMPAWPRFIRPLLPPRLVYREDIVNNKYTLPEKCPSMILEPLSLPKLDFRVQQSSKCKQISEVHRQALLNTIAPNRRHRTKREEIVAEYERKQKLAAQVLDLTPPPMYSKNYVNHRHPEKLLNHDLMQRIKELEPEQEAVQRAVKKNFTRAQFNRQNKNYMYETCSKKNRRSNRQRIPSGANNNRKC